MLAAAKWLLETEAQTLNDVLHANPVSMHNYSQDFAFLASRNGFEKRIV